MIEVEDIGDNSAPRATLRQMRKLAELQTESMLVSGMVSMHCAIPLPGEHHLAYTSQALACRTSQMTNASDARSKCDFSKWTTDLKKLSEVQPQQ